MGRPRTCYVDQEELLTGIHAAHHADLAEVGALVKAANEPYRRDSAGMRWELLRLNKVGVAIDFQRFLGKSLSSGERARCLEALHALEQAKLVCVYGQRASRVLLTPKGLAHLPSKEAKSVTLD